MRRCTHRRARSSRSCSAPTCATAAPRLDCSSPRQSPAAFRRSLRRRSFRSTDRRRLRCTSSGCRSSPLSPSGPLSRRIATSSNKERRSLVLGAWCLVRPWSLVRPRSLVLGPWGLIGLAAALALGCSRPRVPDVNSPAYEDTTRTFYRGLAELQVGLLDDAKRDFGKATDLAPGEPAAWANLGLSHLRLGEFDAAKPPIDKAVSLDPNSSDLIFLRGRLQTSQGKLDEGIADYKRAAELDARNMRVRYALAEELERAGGPNADAQAQQLFETILAARPGNIAVTLERARLAAKRGDAAALRDSI